MRDEAAPGLFAPVRGKLVTAFFGALISGVLSTVPFIAAVEVVRLLLPAADPAASVTVDSVAVWSWVIAGSLCLVVGQTAFFANGMVTHLADLALGDSVRRRITRRLGRLPLGWFDGRSSGVVKKAVQDDVGHLHQLTAHATVELPYMATPAVVVLGYLFVTDWRMALVTMVPLLLGAAGFLLAMRGGTEKIAEYESWLGKLGAATVEYVSGISEIKMFGRKGRSSEAFERASTRFVAFYRAWGRQSSLGGTIMEVALSAPTVITMVALAGIAMQRVGALSAADFIVFLILAPAATTPVTNLIYGLQSLQRAVKASRQLGELLAEPVLPRGEGGLPEGSVRVEMEAVDFSYGEHRVLKNVSFALEPGTTTALVGPSGAGKSTVAQLLPRFFDVDAGSVRIAGVDVRELREDRLYGAISFVFQDTTLLSASLRENIGIARPGAGEEEIRQAAARARILDRIDRLPRGLDSVVGEDARLSGGERQRVCIARALLADTPVLVLDEATAASDPENESGVQRAIAELVRDRTVLVIAHRLDTIRGADNILVLDRGELVEQGDHERLLAADGLYARMWRANREAARGREEKSC